MKTVRHDFTPGFSIIVALLVMAFGSTPALATDYYVSNTGSNGNSGTSASPWATLQYAADNVGPGDVVHVADGFYAGMHITASGTSSSPITFVADGNAAILDVTNPVTTAAIGDSP